METGDSLNILEPHLNASGYKSLDFSITPKHCDFIKLHADGAALLGCSNLTERYWTGAASIADGIEELKTILCEKKTCSKSISLLSGATSGCFIGSSKKVLLAEDSGCISIWSKSENGEWATMWSKDLETEEHDGAVLAVECLSDNQVYVTVGDDANIKIWDIEDFICTKTFRYSQSSINDVSVCVDSKEMFATAATDGAVSLWSQHCDKRVKVLHRGDCEVRCVRWLDEKLAVVGEEGGRLVLLDIRNEKDQVSSVTLPYPPHRLCVQKGTNNIGVCGDSPSVSVFTCDTSGKLNRVYIARSVHTDQVRGLAWDPVQPQVLHSAAWDCTIGTHSIPKA